MSKSDFISILNCSRCEALSTNPLIWSSKHEENTIRWKISCLIDIKQRIMYEWYTQISVEINELIVVSGVGEREVWITQEKLHTNARSI